MTFKNVDGAPYIESEETDASFSIERHSYDAATVRFENIRTAAIPAYAALSAFAVNAQTGIPPLMEP